MFAPLHSIKRDEAVIITTYGLGSVETMRPLLDALFKRSSRVAFIVGYTKSQHDLAALKRTIRGYLEIGAGCIKVWPNFHAKIWCIGEQLWCGSQNFTAGTGPNLMVKTREVRAYNYLRACYAIAAHFSHTTKLELVPNYQSPPHGY